MTKEQTPSVEELNRWCAANDKYAEEKGADGSTKWWIKDGTIRFHTPNYCKSESLNLAWKLAETLPGLTGVRFWLDTDTDDDWFCEVEYELADKHALGFAHEKTEALVRAVYAAKTA